MKKHSSNKRVSGFALIATLMMLVMLLLLAVGIQSVSAISLRSAKQSDALMEARANAKLALMIAIGELQKQVGPDQRITANSSILSETPVRNPHWMGVWDSWIAGNPADAPVKSDYPSGASHHQTIGSQPDATMRPDYANKNKHFRSWLLSLDAEDVGNISSPIDLKIEGKVNPSGSDDTITLVGEGSLGKSADQDGFVHARLLEVKNLDSISGRYAWWVGDESQKARVMHDSYLSTPPASLSDKIFRSQAPDSMGTQMVNGLDRLTAEQDAKLEFIPSGNTLNLFQQNQDAKISQNYFHEITIHSLGVFADVREGGLKRDLSTILERVINPADVYNLQQLGGVEAGFLRAQSIKASGYDYILYNFDNLVSSRAGSPTGEACVPIQDLAAYYQLYDHYRLGWKGGVQFSSRDSSPSNTLLTNGVMVSNPDYGQTPTDYDKYLRQHSAIYRSVYPVKLEVMLSYITEPILPVPTNPNADKYRLRIGFAPTMTWWNPNNVPVVMNKGNPDRASIMIRDIPVPLQFTFTKSATFGGPQVGAPVTVQMSNITENQQSELYTLFISGNNPTVFEPGESKVFAMPFTSGTDANLASTYVDYMLRGGRGSYAFAEAFQTFLEMKPGWNPERFTRPTVNIAAGTRGNTTVLTFKDTDYISTTIGIGNTREFGTSFTQKSRHGRNAPGVMWHYRAYEMRGRMFPGGNPNFMVFSPYRQSFLAAGLNPTGSNISETQFRDITIPARSASILVDSMGPDPMDPRDDLPQGFFYYGMKAATETQEKSNSFPSTGSGSGRRFPCRPFTHSSVTIPPIFDRLNGSSLYNYGWSWYFQPLNNVLDAPVSISRDNHGYYGGGYTVENGATHVIQQEIPLTPPISIAALSHAQLSGYSLSCEAAASGYNGLQNVYTTEAFLRSTATGFGGLEPRTLQAIGNSYAHPNIPGDKAFTTWDRVYYQNTVTEVPVREPFADHSYLANKALWDEFFFSSITPVPANNPLFAPNSPKSVDEVANYFFFENEPLPNRRMVPYGRNLDEDRLNELLSEYSVYIDGFADKIAANMMIEGSFNINSTSQKAWKIFFSSLRGKSVSYLEPERSISGGINIDEKAASGVPISSGFLANGATYTGSSTDPSDQEQWTAWRELTDEEIDSLATAMVKQVKKRGPFLSLSEFVNRRLDRGNPELTVKGALQAAIDDPDCPINEGFRDPARQFSTAEKDFVNPVFPQAMDGAIAYGSAAYVDQADVLRNFAEQLTPRGDSFVIRTYGDSVDSKGNVVARAWCEAVVQRFPEYVDHKSSSSPTASGDAPETKQAELTSETNRQFGRKLQIVSLRWLNTSEI
jgi:type II secretory pathway pseudopilin PulG